MSEPTIEEQDAAWLKRIEEAPDWETTSRLMAERLAWWSKHRRWDEKASAWAPIVEAA